MKTMPYNLTIPTPPSVQSALQQSKAMTEIHDRTSLALTTGKKINTSYDNSSLFFKDVRLSEKAQEINSIMDGLSNIVSTVSAAGKAIDVITKLLDQARAAANSVVDNKNYLAKLTGSGHHLTPDTLLSTLPSVCAGDEILLRRGDADKMESGYVIDKETTLDDLNIVRGEEFKIKIGSENWITLTVFDENMTVSDFLGQVYAQDASESFQLDITDRKLTVSTGNRNPVLMQGSVAEALGFDLSDTHKITIGSNWNVKHLTEAFSDIEGVTAQINSDGHFEICSVYGDDLIVDDLTGKSAASLNVAGFDDCGVNLMKSYADQYNEILKQIDNTVNDASYNGLNLLLGDSVRAVFDERAQNIRTVEGIKTDAASLGLSEAVGDWQNKEDAIKALDEIENAVAKVRYASQKFELASGMILSRDSFLKSLSDSCLNGADALTGADLNDTAVELLAAETQKELVNNVISITMDTNASILSLF